MTQRFLILPVGGSLPQPSLPEEGREESSNGVAPGLALVPRLPRAGLPNLFGILPYRPCTGLAALPYMY